MPPRINAPDLEFASEWEPYFYWIFVVLVILSSIGMGALVVNEYGTRHENLSTCWGGVAICVLGGIGISAISLPFAITQVLNCRRTFCL